MGQFVEERSHIRYIGNKKYQDNYDQIDWGPLKAFVKEEHAHDTGNRNTGTNDGDQPSGDGQCHQADSGN